MNIGETLQRPVWKDARLLAGKDGEIREIRQVNMMDAPDIVDYLQEDDLLVTTGYHYKDRPEELSVLIERMDAVGCAGIGLKIERFLQKLPESVIEKADELQFPIIALPEDIGLGAMVNDMLNDMLSVRTRELREALNIHQRLTDHVMHGKGLTALLEEVCDYIGFPVLLLDAYDRPIYAGEGMETAQTVLETHRRAKRDLFLAGSTYSSFCVWETAQTYTLFPVRTHETRSGCLVIGGEIPIYDNGLVLIIDQAVNVIGFERMKQSAIAQYERRARDEFFQNFINEGYSSDEEARNRAEEMGLPNSRNYGCAVGMLDPEPRLPVTYTQQQREMDHMYEYIEGELDKWRTPAWFFKKERQCIILWEVEQLQAEADEASVEALRQLQEGIQLFFGRSISFGIGNTARSFLDTPASYKEAENTLYNSQLTGERGFIRSYYTKDIAQLLRLLPTEELASFSHSVLQELTEGSQEEQGLVQTLSVYLESHCHVADTAKRLYIHRNTVLYRLEKCEERLGVSLKNPETTMRLRLALRVQNVLSSE
ncbi:PucR family transcriptional regulator [Marinococcus sp. PL1-022]|uniref:PucR family transcriptional regulator n=1 Tax=Marinococcus sp. PL1-022 TaxID=3095363 RepID=UPI0029C35368|nr:PucR family transcriptional regulator [Marinococcus sp. PL1-022]MDX6154199.1 PucR family transcriptional regulator [Marinococcus sp. PL1-022]